MTQASAELIPAAAAAAIVDHLTRGADTDAVFCVALQSHVFAEFQQWRRDSRLKAVPASDCAHDDDQMIHIPDGLRAVQISFSGFQQSSADSATVMLHTWCGSLCGGQWLYRLTGMEAEGWWVQSVEMKLVH